MPWPSPLPKIPVTSRLLPTSDSAVLTPASCSRIFQDVPSRRLTTPAKSLLQQRQSSVRRALVFGVHPCNLRSHLPPPPRPLRRQQRNTAVLPMSTPAPSIMECRNNRFPG